MNNINNSSQSANEKKVFWRAGVEFTLEKRKHYI
jgi:hypothetical protein